MTGQREGHKPGCFNPDCPGDPECFKDHDAQDELTVYPCLVADPPWSYKTPGEGPLAAAPSHRPNSWRDSGASSERRYGSMSMDELKALEVSPATDAHLYLWTTNAFMVQAHELAAAWGFRVITICTWVKTHQKNPEQVSMKTGYYFRGATEHFLFCVRGSLKLQTKEALPTAFLWPRTPHSVKPEAFYDLVEKASPGPYLELFARRNRLGWATWGNQSLVHEDIA